MSANGSRCARVSTELHYLELATLEQARNAWPWPAVPITLLTAMRADSAAGVRLAAIELEPHQAFLEHVPGARHIVTNKSTHSIHMEQPDLVVGAIREVVDADRSWQR